jgi:hypothetical protein
MGLMETSVAVAIGAAIGALMSSGVTAIVAATLGRKLRLEERATRAAVDRLTTAVAGSQAWYWSPEWQEGEREADEDLAEGRYQRFTTTEDMDKALGEVPSSFASSR